MNLQTKVLVNLNKNLNLIDEVNQPTSFRTASSDKKTRKTQ